ncbi:MAG: diaminopimelate epimerase [Legionellales bacterium]|nr:diaminopimelate epimerase [Legionellales bacterium]
MTSLQFTKMHGLGNDFMVIDATRQPVTLATKQIRALANRHRGIGFDQCLLLYPSDDPSIDFQYRIFNADGGEVEQCGNGARCLGRFVAEQQLTTKPYVTVATCNRRMQIQVSAHGNIEVDMGKPHFDPAEVPFLAKDQTAPYHLDLGGETFEFYVVNVGNPHMIICVDDWQTGLISGFGLQLTQHERFPEGVNVNFMQLIDDQHIKLRVVERGTGETEACGSGACASAVIAQQYFGAAARIQVELLGGMVTIHRTNEQSNIVMAGPAQTVYHGTVELS